MTLAMVIAALGSLNSSLLSGARVPYAMARDGIFFHVAATIHPKFRTPGGALVFQGILTSLMVLTARSRAYLAVHFRRLDLLRLGCGGDVSDASQRTRFAETVPLLGLPMGPGCFRDRRHGVDSQPVARAADPIVTRPRLDPLRLVFYRHWQRETTGGQRPVIR